MHPLERIKGQSVLVTGATGFMGTHLARRLAVTVPRLFLMARPGHTLSTKVGTVLEADLRDKDSLERAVAVAAPDMVFHLAAFTDVNRDPDLEERHLAVNHLGTLNLAQALKRSSLKRMVHFGTCEEYGRAEAPFREDQPLKPVSPYSASKAKATLALQQLWRDEGFPVVMLRPFLTYGPGQCASRFTAQAVRAALGHEALPMTPGEQTREFNHIEDVLECVLKSAVVPGLEGEIINIACGEERRLIDVAWMIYKLAGSRSGPEVGALPYREGEAMRFFGCTEKCRTLLDYRPSIRLEEGLKSLIEWERNRNA